MLFIKHSTQGKITTLIVYVEDIFLTNNDDDEEIEILKHSLANEFEIKYFGNLKYFLRIEISRSKHGIFISQRKYILDLLKET